jgi:soluble lytic murein transglycosylase-like protein
MGLMQIMPIPGSVRGPAMAWASILLTRDNIRAGVAYLREMHDRYGPSGFLATYNTGVPTENLIRADLSSEIS